MSGQWPAVLSLSAVSAAPQSAGLGGYVRWRSPWELWEIWARKWENCNCSTHHTRGRCRHGASVLLYGTTVEKVPFSIFSLLRRGAEVLQFLFWYKPIMVLGLADVDKPSVQHCRTSPTCVRRDAAWEHGGGGIELWNWAAFSCKSFHLSWNAVTGAFLRQLNDRNIVQHEVKSRRTISDADILLFVSSMSWDI